MKCHPILVAATCAVMAMLAGCSTEPNHSQVTQAPSDTRAELPTVKGTAPATLGSLETVALFNGPMPTGVSVSHSGRIFVNFPRWGDEVDYTVGEVKNGRVVAYPERSIQSL